MTLGQNIQTARRAKGLSQEELAGRIGVSRQALGKWEKDTALPGLENLRQLSAELGISADALMGRAAVPSAGPAQSDDPPMTLEAMKALLDARDAAAARRRRGWLCTLGILGTAAVLAVFLLAGSYRASMDSLRGTIGSLQNQVGLLNSQVSGYQQQLSDTIAQAGNGMADWSCRVAGYDRATGELKLSLRASPKELPAGTEAVFVLDTGDDALRVPAQEQDGTLQAACTVPFQSLGSEPALRLQWQLADGTVRNELLGTLYMFDGTVRSAITVAVEENGNYAYRTSAGGLTLTWYPVEVQFATPGWLGITGGELRLLLDGEIADRAPLTYDGWMGLDGTDGGAFSWQDPFYGDGVFLCTFDAERYPLPWSGGDVALQAVLTDECGNEWQSEPVYLSPAKD